MVALGNKIRILAVIRQWHSDRRPIDAMHLRRATARHHAGISKATDHRNALHTLGERQRVLAISQQDDAFCGNRFGNLGVGLEIDLLGRYGLISANGIDGTQHALIHIRDALRIGVVVRGCLRQGLVEIHRSIEL